MKSAKFLVGMASFVVCFQAFAGVGTAKVHEAMKDKIEKSTTQIRANRPALEQRTANLVQKISEFSTKVDSTKLAQACREQFQIAADGSKVDVLEVSRLVFDAHEAVKELRSNTQLEADARALVEIKAQIVEMAPQFIELAAKISDKNSEIAQAYLKEVSLIPEVLASYGKEEAQSHLDMMKSTVDQAVNPSVTADASFRAALAKKYGEQSLVQKLKEILGCARG